MSALAELLPPTPAGFQRFGWNGLALVLPESWNLRAHLGTEKQGALIFADMLRIRLELRWKSALRFWPGRARPVRLLERTLGRLQKRGRARIIAHEGYTEVRHDATAPSATVLVTHEDKLIELHWPGTERDAVGPGGARGAGEAGEHLATIAPDFAKCCRRLAGNPLRFWSVYGATGDIPAPPAMGIRTLSMLPGATRLAFRGGLAGTRRITLGSYSRADRLLGTDALDRWAVRTIPFLQRHAAASWEVTADRARLSLQTREGLLRRRIQHTVSVGHDRAANRIQWTHSSEPAKS